MNFRRFPFIVLVFVLSGFLWFSHSRAWGQPNNVLDVYFFHSETCPHCAQQKPLMERIDRYNDDVEVHLIEVFQDPQTWQAFLERYQITSTAVPRTFVADKSFIGYSDSDGPLEYVPVHSGYIGYRNQIIQAIEAAIGHKIRLTDTGNQSSTATPAEIAWFPLALPALYLVSLPLVRRQLRQPQIKRYWLGGLATITILSLFLFVNGLPDVVIKTVAQQLPFPLFVSTIAIADGFNPCAFTVLIILLSLLTYTKHRRDMLLVGGTFIATSAVMYFLFILLMVLVGSFLLEQYGRVFLLLLGGGIAIAGIINLKDYFWFKQGVSLSLTEDQQLTISQKAGQIVRGLRAPAANRWQFLMALGGTVLLAVFVNVIELGCTAILPAVYMTTLVNYCAANFGSATLLCYSLWTGLYAVIYVIPLLLILANFIYSFESSRLTETQGRRLKLVAGLFMLFFGLVMLFKPDLLML